MKNQSGDGLLLERRDFLRTSALLSGAAIAAPGLALAPSTAVADAHLHLFNASDLPAAGFVKYVYFPSKFGELPSWGAAAIDLFVGFIKPFAVTIADEERILSASATARPELTADEFGGRIAAHIETRTAEIAGGDSNSGLVDSYDDLSRAVAMDGGFTDLVQRQPRFFSDTIELAHREAVNRRSFRIVAEKAEREAGPSPGIAADKALGRFSMTEGFFGLSGGAARLVGWAYMMMKSRSQHLDHYLDKFSDGSAAPQLLLAHLVDYDMWVDDSPSPESDHVRQARFMAALAKANRTRVDLRVFAAFCPLKHAIEVRSGRSPTTFDRNKPLLAAGQVSGFKVYPPMGFLPIGNTGLGDAAFDPRQPGRRTALDFWRAAGAGPTEPLGPALDAALRELYHFCTEANVPIMAHAGPGNEAGKDYGARANPLYWEQVVRDYPLRLSLGHLVNEAKPFVKAVADGPPYPAKVWALGASVRMLASGAAGQVYGDLAYMPELIDDPRLATEFFIALRQAFGAADPQLTRILYGTDWIMLGLEAHSGRYLRTVRKAMAAADYSPEQQRNILYDNGRRYLAGR
jgi:predicted TIM-barrel fold metal-dependent hydrolase